MNISNRCENDVEQYEEDIGGGFFAEYTLYESILENRFSYSIKVTLANTGESAIVRDVTSDCTVAHLMFEMIRRGGVTPCCLTEVMEDLIETVYGITPAERSFSTYRENTL